MSQTMKRGFNKLLSALDHISSSIETEGISFMDKISKISCMYVINDVVAVARAPPESSAPLPVATTMQIVPVSTAAPLARSLTLTGHQPFVFQQATPPVEYRYVIIDAPVSSPRNF